MYCTKCGSPNAEGTKYCTSCGNELNNSNFNQQFNNGNVNNLNSNVPNNQIYNNQNIAQKNNNDNKYGKTSMILGIVSISTSLIFSVFILPVSIVGIVLGAKSKNDSKGIVGIVLNSISIVLIILEIFALCFIFGLIFNEYSNYSYEGNYKCAAYQSDVDVTKLTKDIDFQLADDKTFTMIQHDNSGISSIKGTYNLVGTNFESTQNTYTYTLNLNATERIVEGKTFSDPYTTQYSISFNDDDEIILMNTLSSNTYYCERD